MTPLDPTVLAVGAVAALLAVSAFFSSSEIALFSLPADWNRTETGDRRSATLQRLREDPHRLLVTLLVGNNVVNVAISSIVTVTLADRLPEGQAVAAATVAASVVVLLFGEILPKAYGLGHARSWSLTVARPIELVGVVLFPLVVVFDALTGRLSAVFGGEGDLERPYTGDESNPDATE